MELQSVGGETEEGRPRGASLFSYTPNQDGDAAGGWCSVAGEFHCCGEAVELQSAFGETEEGRPQGASLFCYTPDRT